MIFRCSIQKQTWAWSPPCNPSSVLYVQLDQSGGSWPRSPVLFVVERKLPVKPIIHIMNVQAVLKDLALYRHRSISYLLCKWRLPTPMPTICWSGQSLFIWRWVCSESSVTTSLFILWKMNNMKRTQWGADKSTGTRSSLYKRLKCTLSANCHIGTPELWLLTGPSDGAECVLGLIACHRLLCPGRSWRWQCSLENIQGTVSNLGRQIILTCFRKVTLKSCPEQEQEHLPLTRFLASSLSLYGAIKHVYG